MTAMTKTYEKVPTKGTYWGLSFGHHDAGMAVIKDGELVYASHGERYSRVKNDTRLHPQQLIEAHDGWGLPDRVFYFEDPWRTKQRHLMNLNWNQIADCWPKRDWARLKQQVFGPNPTYGEPRFLEYGSHHMSHAAAGFYTSGFNDAYIFCVDAVGERESVVVYEAKDGRILPKPLFVSPYPNSLGLLYTNITQLCGLKPNEDEYILMGMATLEADEGTLPITKGDIDHIFAILKNLFWWEWFKDEYTSRFPVIKTAIDFNVSMEYHALAAEGDTRDRVNFLRGFAGSSRGRLILARAVQKIVQQYLYTLITSAVRDTDSHCNIVLGGGVALNCVANSHLTMADNWLTAHMTGFHVFPNPGDAGSAVGAILAHTQEQIALPNLYLGTDAGPLTPERIEDALQALKAGRMVALCHGRAEFGPRALGNRSLIADPRPTWMKDRVNEVKRRQKFRPFAPAVLESYYHLFDLPKATHGYSPFMQFTARCTQPNKYPAIVHGDGTSRVQTVNQSDNGGFAELLWAWFQETKCPILLNTSLNIKGEPLVNNYAEALAFKQYDNVEVV